MLLGDTFHFLKFYIKPRPSFEIPPSEPEPVFKSGRRPADFGYFGSPGSLSSYDSPASSYLSPNWRSPKSLSGRRAQRAAYGVLDSPLKDKSSSRRGEDDVKVFEFDSLPLTLYCPAKSDKNKDESSQICHKDSRLKRTKGRIVVMRQLPLFHWRTHQSQNLGGYHPPIDQGRIAQSGELSPILESADTIDSIETCSADPTYSPSNPGRNTQLQMMDRGSSAFSDSVYSSATDTSIGMNATNPHANDPVMSRDSVETLTGVVAGSNSCGPSVMLTLATPELQSSPVASTKSSFSIAEYKEAAEAQDEAPPLPDCLCSLSGTTKKCSACEKQWLACELWYHARVAREAQNLVRPFFRPQESNASNRKMLESLGLPVGSPKGLGIQSSISEDPIDSDERTSPNIKCSRFSSPSPIPVSSRRIGPKRTSSRHLKSKACRFKRGSPLPGFVRALKESLQSSFHRCLSKI